MTWRRVPLFVWAIYAHQHHHGPGDAGARPVAGRWSASTTSTPRHLRSRARRRSGAVPAPVLVLLAPGGLHHDPAGDGRDQRDGLHLCAPPPGSYAAIAISSLGIAFVGFLTWGHHMFVAGMSELDAGIFGALSMFVAIFSAIKVFTWVATLYKGQIQLQHADALLLRVSVPVRLRRDDRRRRRDAVARRPLARHLLRRRALPLHHGGRQRSPAFLAAAHYWFPKMFGRLYSERVGLLTATAVFLGFVLTFLPQFLLGNMGMPRRYYSYPGALPVAARALDRRRVPARRARSCSRC